MEFIETGKIVNTHGIAGEVKIEPWADSPEALIGLTKLRIDGKEYRILASRVHKSSVLMKLEGVNDMTAAESLRGKTVHALKSEIPREEGAFFVEDLEGLKVIDADTDKEYGTLTQVIQNPGVNDVYEITTANGEKLYVPAIKDCVIDTDLKASTMKIRPLPGLFD
ncbi:MAG: ribosome maturation factor RimM [Eubacteriales bacterium]